MDNSAEVIFRKLSICTLSTGIQINLKNGKERYLSLRLNPGKGINRHLEQG